MEEKIMYQRLAFAIKACHMMGKTIQETAKLLVMPEPEVDIVYAMIDEDLIDFNEEI